MSTTTDFEDDEDTRTVAELIEDLPEPDTYYPVVLEATERRVVWVEAESAAAALARMQDWPHDSWDHSEPLDGGGISAVLPRSWDDEARELLVGPVESCPECGAAADDRESWSWKYIQHARGCSRLKHYVDFVLAGSVGPDGRNVRANPQTYLPSCSCKEPGWAADYKTRVGDPAAPEPVAADARAALAQAHVAGRPHSKNVPLGLEGADLADLGIPR